MDFDLISNAFAEGAAAPAQADGGYSLLMIGAIFILFYFMLIRPQNKRAKAHRDLIAQLAKDDEVSIASGILGRVEALDEQYVQLEIAPSVEITVQRNAVNAVLPKGTMSSMSDNKKSTKKDSKK